jgi:hypothetical protein
MLEKAGGDYRYTLKFNEAKYFAVEDILEFMAKAEYSFWLSGSPAGNSKSFSLDGADSVNSFSAIGDAPAVQSDSDLAYLKSNSEFNQKEFTTAHREYLSERIQKAVIDKKFELWDLNSGKVVSPPSRQTIVDAMESSSFSKSLWGGIKSKLTFWKEPSFIGQLKKSQQIPSSYRSHPPVYSTEFWWLRMSSILKSDLIRFCEGENIYAQFREEEVLKSPHESKQEKDHSESKNGLDGIQGNPIDRKRLANAKELADAFKIKNDVEENREWFRERCSNPARYKNFKDAHRVHGSRGAGNTHLFDVLILAAHFEEMQRKLTDSTYFKSPRYKAYLRTQVDKHFHELLEEFDLRFGTGENE